MIFDRTAIERVKAGLTKPDISSKSDAGIVDEYFDPWSALFPYLYGSYSADFGIIAIESLEEVMNCSHSPHLDSLPHKMFKEMLCTQELCEYGTSPRTCFPETEFKEVIAEIIQRFKHYEEIYWSDHV